MSAEDQRPCGRRFLGLFHESHFITGVEGFARTQRPTLAQAGRGFRVDAFDGEFSEMVNVALHNLDCEGDCLGCCVQMRDQCVLPAI